MISSEEPDPDAKDPTADDPQRLLILAYTRLFLLPERPDGSKQTIVTSFGPFQVRLSELSPAVHSKSCPLWIELCDSVGKSVIDSIGCQDLQEAGEAVEAFVSEAKRLSNIVPPEHFGF